MQGVRGTVSASSSGMRQKFRMKTTAYALGIGLLLLAAPAHATGGLECKTAGAEPLTIHLGFGHVPNAGLFLAKLFDGDHEIAVDAPQFWMEGSELRLALRPKGVLETELVLKADWNEQARAYDGAIWRSGKQRWVRCRGD